MFRRRRNDERSARPDGEAAEPVDAVDQADAADQADAGEEPGDTPAAAGDRRAAGPWDVSEVDDLGERLDLGALLLRGAAGMEVQLQVEESTGQVVAVHAVIGQSALQLQPFAAPRTEGIWDEVRAEIAAGLTGQGGTCSEAQGPFGTELRAQVPAQLPDGTSGIQQVRFLGVDGPRWFLRGVISGEGAVDPGAAEPLEAVFRDVVVVRGDAPMTPRAPIPLTVPQQQPQAEAEEGDGREPLEPFRRGPEITEVR